MVQVIALENALHNGKEPSAFLKSDGSLLYE